MKPMKPTREQLDDLWMVAKQVAVTIPMEGDLRNGYQCRFCGVRAPLFFNVTHAETCAYPLARKLAGLDANKG